MIFHVFKTIQTERYNQSIRVTECAREALLGANVQNGVIYVITNHTTTGIAVNEHLECIESDIQNMLARLVPENDPYLHARMLPTYGQTAGNPTGHLKSHLTGNHCVFPIVDGEVRLGAAQEIFLMEFDGPARRTIHFTIIGE
ncbi:MAG: secondary thiamine-phosphate synthase enzyme YjbQ [Clostridiales Family XIII bacterium]|jgi:secondary thiamine-phosphate synthase enzyme|nr:secondary thiamine-phosphate synthase enzyme YjbQ [Clostridiales Family XIII bacterium]